MKFETLNFLSQIIVNVGRYGKYEFIKIVVFGRPGPGGGYTFFSNLCNYSIAFYPDFIKEENRKKKF